MLPLIAGRKINTNGAARQQPVNTFTEIGSEGLSAFYGHISESYVTKLEWPAAYDVYNQMRRREPTLRSILNAIKLLGRQAEWKAEAPTDKPADREAADFLQSNLEDMSHTVEDFIDDCFSFLPFGWSSFETVYKRRNGPGGDSESQFTDGRIGWRKFAFRRQSSFNRWEMDDNGGFNGWWQQAKPDYRDVWLPPDRLLHFVGERDGSNPEGLSLFESAYEPYHFVTNLQIISGIGWQRTFVGLPVFEFENSPTSDDKAAVKSTGEALTVDEKQYVSSPPGVKFRLESTTNAGAEALLRTIREYRILMTQMVLADFIFLGTSDTGSWALGSDKSQLFIMAVNGYLDKIEAIWNRFGTKRLFDYNEFSGITELPRVTHSAVRKPNLTELGSFISQIAPYITIGDEDEIWIREQAGMPEMEQRDEMMPDEDQPPQPETGGDEDATDDDGEQFGEFKFAGDLVELAEFDGRDEDRTGIEQQHTRLWQRLLREQRERVLAAIAAGAELDNQFWDGEKKIFSAALTTALALQTNKLIAFTIADTERLFRISSDWGLVNEAALRWAKEFAAREVTAINATTRAATRQAVANWIETGDGLLKNLVKTLEPTYGPKRAKTIAVTEITTAYTEGNISAWKSAGIVQSDPDMRPVVDTHIGCYCWLIVKPENNGSWSWIWKTRNEKGVCPICDPLHNEVVGVAREARQ